MKKFESSINDLLRIRIIEAKKHLMHGDTGRISLMARCSRSQVQSVISGSRRGLTTCKNIVEAIERVALENKTLKENHETQNK